MGIAAQALDGVYGRSASGLRARLERSDNGGWLAVGKVESDDDGYISQWADEKLERGLYRLVFDSDHYFSGLGVTAAYPEITVVFRVEGDDDPCSVQIILAPYSYSTYFRTSS